MTIKIYEVNPQYIDYLIVNGINYFAPLSSFKTKHKKMKNGLDFIKGEYTYVDIPTVKDPQYRKLLMTEYRITRKLQDKIIKNAAEVYKHKFKSKFLK